MSRRGAQGSGGDVNLLDTFSAGGGCSAGYQAAGFDVYGIDLDPQPSYRHPFHRGDALHVLRTLLDGGTIDFGDGRLALGDFAVIHASPPCQGYSTITPDHRRDAWPRLIAPVRELLVETGLPYVIENVEGAKRELRDPARLCGSSFGLEVRRHRWFESNVWLTGLPCRHTEAPDPVGVYGDHWDSREFLRPDGSRRGAKATSLEHAKAAMGIGWDVTWHDLIEAVPPAMTEFIGLQLKDALVPEVCS